MPEREKSVAAVSGVPITVEQTERSFMQSTESSMGGDILLGLIELITNSDDQYGDQSGSILIRLPKPDSDGAWDAEVRDKAGGLDFADIGPKLLRFGASVAEVTEAGVLAFLKTFGGNVASTMGQNVPIQ